MNDAVKRALILVDFINLFDFEHSEKLAARAVEAAKRTAALKKRTQAAGMPCIYANDNFGHWTSEFSALVQECLRKGGASGEIAKTLHPGRGDYSVLKPRHSAFYQTPLEFLLQELEVGSLIQALRDDGHDPRPSSLDPDCVLLDGGDPTTLPGFREGWFAIQDHASAFVVRVLDPRPGERIADVCAAPGGKALHASGIVGVSGAVVAADRSERRVGLIRREARRLDLAPWLVVHDATQPALDDGFDRVLVDAPCSGIGSARRRPELLWRIDAERLTTFAGRQLRLVEAAADLVRPGGRLVYSVCTFPRAETEAVCDALLRLRGDLRPLATAGPDGTSERHRLWPHRHGSDGMFVAAFSRSGAIAAG